MNKSLWFTYRIFEPVLSLAILVHNVRFEKTFSLDLEEKHYLPSVLLVIL